MDVSAIAIGGLEQAQSQLESTANRIASPANPVDGVDLSQEAVSLLQARTDFQANLATLKVNDQMLQSLFDVLG
jgi:flagellar hook-associated protein FlgK